MANVVLQNLHVGPAAVSPSHDIEVFACTIEQEGFDGSLACKRKGRQWLIQTMVNGAVRSEQAHPTALQQGDDAVHDDVARVWGCDDAGRSWAGAPDIIGVVGNKLTLADLKTSVKPYSRKWPKDLEKGSPEWRDLLGGHMKFKKTCKQLAAYDIAIEQTLGMKVQQAAILVSTPVRTQVFKISRNFLNSLRDDWYKIVEEYYKQVEETGEYDADLV